MTKPLIGIGSDVYVHAGERDRAFVYTTYVDSLRRAGAIPVLIPPQPENAAGVVAELDGLLLAGGDDCDPAAYGEPRHPTVEPMDSRRQEYELSLFRVSRECRIFTLCIRLACSSLSVALRFWYAEHIGSDLHHSTGRADRYRH